MADVRSAVREHEGKRVESQRIGYFVRRVDRRGRKMNAGLWWEMTDKKGEFWLTDPDNCRPIEAR